MKKKGRRGMLIFSLLFCCILILMACTKDSEENVQLAKEAESFEKVATDNLEKLQVEQSQNDIEPEEAVLEMGSYVVQVLGSNIVGSGVVYHISDEQLIIVTAGHVVENTEQIEVRLPEIKEENGTGVYIEVTGVWVVEGLDLAFLTVPITEEMQEIQHIKEFFGSSLEKSDDVDMKEEQVSLLGYDKQGECVKGSAILQEEWIYVEDFQCHMLLAKGEAVAGMSGGGVFDSVGKLLGIICGVNEEGQIAALPESVMEGEFELLFK